MPSPLKDPYEAAIGEIGDGWTFLVTREAFFGARRFEHFRANLGVPRARLTERLNHLVEIGVFERKQYQDHPVRFEYRLTPKGFGIYPIALALLTWGDEWRAEGLGPPLTLTHTRCGKEIVPVMICTGCGEALGLDSLKWPAPGLSVRPGPGRRWRRIAANSKTGSESGRRNDSVGRALSVLGDRWTMIVLHEIMRGSQRFGEIQERLDIATNVLTDRLDRMVEDGLLERQPGVARGSAGYVLANAGCDTLGALLCARIFGVRFCEGASQSMLRHTRCGARTHGALVCGSCTEPISAHQVRYQPN